MYSSVTECTDGTVPVLLQFILSGERQTIKQYQRVNKSILVLSGMKEIKQGDGVD